MLDNNKKYIKRLKEKALKTNDIELIYLVNKLIIEREELLRSVKIDYLTGIYNRNILDDIENYSVVVICDIDNFKSINDTYGHAVGDIALKTLSKALISNTRITDYICRYGGDEFLIVFDDCDLDVAYDRIDKIQKELSKPIRKYNFSIYLSAGISVREKDESLKETINNADIALYNSKTSGKNKVTIYNSKKLVLRH